MRTDWLIGIDTNDEVLDANGDYAEGASAEQEAHTCIESKKGAFTQFPASGFGIVDWIRNTADGAIVNEPKKFIRQAKVELEADGHISPEVYVTNRFDDLVINISK
ncbi:hypothetical protein CAP35_13735 [Chitinophagaceae bacterium IBVUCB1]|nr:hypothetical protein CAP35_13735 [Chitinophagaceae bacterium IBVUCB1]